MSQKKTAIPDRWLDYESVGKQINDTPFVAFKVPLRNLFTDDISPLIKFSPSDLMKMLPNLSLVIDLTNTEKYYSGKEFLEGGIEYQKIFCPGHQIPPKNLLKKFFDIVDNFLQNKSQSDQVCLIGVHCTHGINRTGFFICSYMINKMGYDSEKAISEFNSARGHRIERENYLKALKNYDTNPLIFPAKSTVEHPHPQSKDIRYRERMPQYHHDRNPNRYDNSRERRGYRNHIQNSPFFNGPSNHDGRFHNVPSHRNCRTRNNQQGSYQFNDVHVVDRLYSNSKYRQRNRERNKQPSVECSESEK